MTTYIPIESGTPFKPLQEQERFTIKSSPFVFLRRVAYIQVFLALVAVLFTAVFGEDRVSESLQLLNTLLALLVTIAIITAVQVTLIALAFIIWRLETYEADMKRVIFQRGGLFEARLIAETQKIDRIQIRQSWLGRRLDYGSLRITSDNGGGSSSSAIFPIPSVTANCSTT
jgi:membrane protein YdbS with pleckstrin-like domain